MPIKLLFMLIFSVNTSVFAMNNPDLSSAKVDNAWMKLMHNYDIQDDRFYETANFKTSVEDEYKANFSSFLSDTQYSCRFPARAKYFAIKNDRKYSECPLVEKWKESIRGQTLSLVFVSQYVSNPASAFGHTFLLFRRSEVPLNFNSIVSNAAHIPDETGDFEYIWKGLVGGFASEFSHDYLYLKFQEYSNMENRDMWIYDLDFSDEQKDQVLNHIWEISHRTSPSYKFLNKNCAVNTYDILAAIHPSLNFMPPSFYVLPVETVIQVNPIIKSYEYIPSLREKMHLRTQKLSEKQIDEFKKIITHSTVSVKTSDVDVAELVLENFELQRVKHSGKLSAQQEINLKESLINRATLDDKPKTIEISSAKSPHLALMPMQIALSAFNENDKMNYSLSFSPLHHSLLSRSNGYLPFSEFILFKLDALKNSDNESIDLTLFQVANFPSTTVFDNQFSWRAIGKLRSIKSKINDTKIDVDFSVGRSIQTDQQSRLFALVGAFQNQFVSLSPQILLGGLYDASVVNLLGQIRLINDMNLKEFSAIPEFGLNYSFKEQNQIELFASYSQKQELFKLVFGHNF